MRDGLSVESTVVRGWWSDSCGFPENGFLDYCDVSSETIKESSGEESGYSGGGICYDGGSDVHSGERGGCCVGSRLGDLGGSLVLCRGIVVYLVGKIRLFIDDEKGGSSEKIGGSGVVEEKRRNVGYPCFVVGCSAMEFDVSGIVSVDSGLERRGCVDGLDECSENEERRIVGYGVFEDSGYLVL